MKTLKKAAAMVILGAGILGASVALAAALATTVGGLLPAVPLLGGCYLTGRVLGAVAVEE